MYTMGPLQVQPYPNPDFAYAIWKGGVRLALIDRRPQLAVAEEAGNAYLFATAPRLVAALKGLLGAVQQQYGYATADNWPAVVEARAALALVRGE